MALVNNSNLMAKNAVMSFSSLHWLAAGLAESKGAENTQQASNQVQGAVGQTSGESLAAGSAEQAKGALVNSSDSGAGGGQAAAGQGGLAAMPQANSNSPIPQSTDATPVMNSSAAFSRHLAELNMADPSLDKAIASAIRQEHSAHMATTLNTIARQEQMIMDLFKTTG